MKRAFQLVLSIFALVSGLLASANAGASTTTIGFNALSNGDNVTTQFQSVGVVFSGAAVLISLATPWGANPYGENIIYSQSGLITITLAPSIIGNVNSVSGYVSGTGEEDIRAYDAGGTLVGETAVPTGGNLQFSVTSSGNPITSVQISGAADSFVIDELIFNSNVAFASFSAKLYLAPKISGFAVAESFQVATNGPAIAPATQPVTLTIGSLNISLPAGSFLPDNVPRKGSYVYRGKVNGVDLFVWISPPGTSQTYSLYALGVGYAFPTGLSSVSVSLSVSSNTGTVNVTPHYVSRPPAQGD